MSHRWIYALTTGSLLLAGCYASPPYVVQGPPPLPAAPAEAIPPQPASGYVWVPGGYVWQMSSRTYVWVPGHWTVPPPGYVWVPGHWETSPSGTVWVGGQWRR
ncbi:MAG: YXWGXW repeat-containing protein [Candidatus Rokuibacteriota bacterium]